MKSNDIYNNVGEKMAEVGSTGLILPPAEKVIADLESALIEYTNEKLLEANINDDIVDDLGVMLDKLDSAFKDEEEKEEFYSHYVHCMLNVETNLSPEKTIMWTPVEQEELGITYPRFDTFGTYMIGFETSPSHSNKENALWLNNWLVNKYQQQKVAIKK